MDVKGRMWAAAALRRWRKRSAQTIQEAAEELGISSRMLLYYEGGEYAVPRAIQLAVRALEEGLGQVGPMQDARERWVTLIGNMRAYGQGHPVVGKLLKKQDKVALQDFLAFVRRGPDPRLALTDPALFKTLRQCCTRAQLAGLGHADIDDRAWQRFERARRERASEDMQPAPRLPITQEGEAEPGRGPARF